MAISRQAGLLIGLDKDESGSGEAELEGRLRAYLVITPYPAPHALPTYVRTCFQAGQSTQPPSLGWPRVSEVPAFPRYLFQP